MLGYWPQNTVNIMHISRQIDCYFIMKSFLFINVHAYIPTGPAVQVCVMYIYIYILLI